MTVTRRTVIATLGAVPLAAALGRTAFAAYPDRTIHLIVPFAPGGNADIVGRLVGDAIGKALSGTVVVDNRAGAGGGIGAELVARAKPDGYTLLVGSNGPLTVNPFVQANLAYDPLKDFEPVALTSYVPHVLILTNKVEAKTVAEVVALSKTKPLNIATSGVGSASHMTLARLAAATGAQLTHIPYRGGGALISDLIAGGVDGAVTEFSTALPLHKEKQAHIVAIASAHRSQLAPDIPTFIEGGVKDFTASSYIGIVAPAKTPADVVGTLQKAIAAGLTAGPTADRLKELGSEIATPEEMTPQGFAAFIKTDYANMKDAAKLADIKPS
ncbi:MAG TPA: tripartite tricarboxylate transporter substrate binding protein [Alphaproteobacteria bacterium]|nr:tripartite tricarboxylate transporter substrate binding protein [Alphaproteobacteria bacterium]